MHGPNHPTLTPTLTLALTLALTGCGPGPAGPEPPQGRPCFELLRATLPPGAQYEGASAAGDRIRIRVMNGVDLQTLECRLDADGRPRAVTPP
jgi:hypothetical protein